MIKKLHKKNKFKDIDKSNMDIADLDMSDVNLIENSDLTDPITQLDPLSDYDEENEIDFSDYVDSFENDDWDDDYNNYIPIETNSKQLASIDRFNRHRNKPKKLKVPMTKRKKRIVYLTTLPLIVLFGVILTFASMFLMVNGLGQKIDSTTLKVDMHDNYYVGTVNKIVLNKMFPVGTDFTISNADESTTLVNSILTVGTKNFKLSYQNSETNKQVKLNVTVIKDGINIDTYEELYKNAHTTKEELTESTVKSPVVIQIDTLSLKIRYKTSDRNRQATIHLTNSLYGNGCLINVNKVVYGYGSDWRNSGFTAFQISNESAVKNKPILIRDLQLIGKEAEASDTLKTFTNYGPLLNIEGGTKGDKTLDQKAKVDIENCIFERGHKVVHMRNAEVNMTGTIVRTAADTTVSIATAANSATVFNIKNSVIADSLTAGILMYCIDGSITKEDDNMDTWNTVNIIGFLDIYNWKKSSEIALLPDTEGGPQVANLANTIVRSEVDNPGKNQKYKVSIAGEQYLHFGIIQICTVSNAVNLNKSIINNAASQSFLSEQFPIPTAAGAIIRDVKVTGYMNNADGAVTPELKIKDKISTLYEELWNGRA